MQHSLLGRRRGLGVLIYMVINGFREGDMMVIGITLGIVAIIIAFIVVKVAKGEKSV